MLPKIPLEKSSLNEICQKTRIFLNFLVYLTTLILLIFPPATKNVTNDAPVLPVPIRDVCSLFFKV